MYTQFADIYDTLMKDLDYESWADFYEKIFEKYGIIKSQTMKEVIL